MEFKLIYQPLDRAEADAVAVVVFEEEPAPPELKSAHAWFDELRASAEFTGKTGELSILHQPQKFAAKRLVAAGGGKRAAFDSAALRRAVATSVRALKQKGIKRLAWVLAAGHTAADAEAAVEGAVLGNFEPDAYKTSTKESKPLEEFHLIAAPNGAELEEAVERGRILAEAQNFTRDLANEPANRLTPLLLAERARAMAAEMALECEVLDQDRMRQLGMGALLGVAQGSAEPPALIVVRYKPATPPKTSDHLGLVGKGVTFDTGGVSIKPADGMEKMKYDMSGGAAVLGAMKAIAQLKPAIPVTALVPAVENMVGGRAQRPGDIVTSLAGKTVEVLNTDAEGRLILIDALTYAQRLGCTHLIDAATLTGAIVVALGYVNIGAFTNNEDLLARVMAVAKTEGEKMWHMPLDDDYKELLKSAFADMANIGGRWGGAISAAWFLREFVGETPWVHLDIAGTAWLDDAKPYMAKGPTGVCVRTFAKLAMGW
ncbi:MAG: leucyl aminopeptidase [Bryobacterales bacterium]|nr:leucyl aminopeptidase [Bryobacterales bacterium]MBV9397868.1 leucyl aminopeptidase [Bryobacterales bacterium]